jgi:hypothetical protein
VMAAFQRGERCPWRSAPYKLATKLSEMTLSSEPSLPCSHLPTT